MFETKKGECDKSVVQGQVHVQYFLTKLIFHSHSRLSVSYRRLDCILRVTSMQLFDVLEIVRCEISCDRRHC
jgi:hypothetical protein